MGPSISDYYKRLILLSVILLSGGHCIIIIVGGGVVIAIVRACVRECVFPVQTHPCPIAVSYPLLSLVLVNLWVFEAKVSEEWVRQQLLAGQSLSRIFVDAFLELKIQFLNVWKLWKNIVNIRVHTKNT